VVVYAGQQIAQQANANVNKQVWGNILYNVKTNKAKGDGTTDDTAAVQATVTAAYTDGVPVEWPAGTYIITANITNFHNVRHMGEGVVKRGTDLFHIYQTDTDTNRIYLSTTGVITNDGLSSDQPLATFQQAFDVLERYGPMLPGKWEINALAGTYTITSAQTISIASKNRIVIKGPAKTHPEVPTCIVDGTGGGSYDHGLVAVFGTYTQFQDIRFQNFTASPSATRIGLLGDVGSDMYTKNVHATNCDWAGIYESSGTARIEGGILNANGIGFAAYNSRATIGYNANVSSNRPIITNNTVNGIYWYGISNGHVDYCNIEDNAIGVLLDYNSRIHGVQNNYKRNAYHIRVETGSQYLNDSDIYNDGTPDAATQISLDKRAYSGESVEQRQSYSEMRVQSDRNVYTHTGSTAKTTIATPYTVPAYRLRFVASKLRVKVYGFFNSVSAGTAVGLDLGATQATLLTVTAVPGASAGFIAEYEILPASVNSQRCVASLITSNQSPRLANSGITADNSSSLDVKITAQLGNTADLLTINRIEVFLMG
jgi:hypothetical protein